MSTSLLVANLLGLALSFEVIRTVNKRKFFCVCDKVTIGGGRPLAWVGLVAHAVGVGLSVTEWYAWQFYVVSLWVYMLFVSASVTYKSARELCWACISLPTIGLWTAWASCLALEAFPWLYLSCLGVMLCVLLLMAGQISSP